MRFYFIKGFFQLQILVSRKKNKNRMFLRIKSVVSTILIFSFAIISSAVLITEKKKYKAYDERIFYFVSVGSSKIIKMLDDKKELLKNLGGANMLMSYKGLSHLIVNVYLDQESANEIKENLKQHFPEVDILKIRLNRLSGKNIKKIKSINGAEMFIKQLFAVSNRFQHLQMEYLKGTMSEGAFLSEIVEIKINIDKLIKNIDTSTDFAQKIVGFGELFVLQLTNFLSGLSIAKHKQNYVCNYFVGFYMNYVDLFDCLHENGKL